MAVVRIDGKLLREIKKIIEKDGYEYPSISNFVNSALYEKITDINNNKKKK